MSGANTTRVSTEAAPAMRSWRMQSVYDAAAVATALAPWRARGTRRRALLDIQAAAADAEA